MIATGVSADGRREVLGFDVGDSEDGAFWTAFLRSLKARGLARGAAGHLRRPRRAEGRDRRGAARRRLATLPGPLPAQRPGPGAQGHAGDGRRRDPHDLRPTRRRARPRAARRHRRHARPAVPQGRGDAARRRRGHPRLRRLPASRTGRRSGPPTRSSGSTRRSNAAPTSSASSPTPPPCSASPAPSWSRPTTSGRSPTAATSPKAPWPMIDQPATDTTQEVATHALIAS